MEKEKTGIWASLIDVIRAIRDKQAETSKQGENLGDIPASHYAEANVTKEELKELKKSLAKLGVEEQLGEPEINNGRAELVSRYKAGSTGGSQGKTVPNRIERPEEKTR